GRRDNDVDAAPQAADLLGIRLTAVNGKRDNAMRLAVAVDRLGDLHAQFTRRHQDDCQGRMRPCCAASRWTRGRANAAVLPVPVAAWPIRSRPKSSGGIASRWI